MNLTTMEEQPWFVDYILKNIQINSHSLQNPIHLNAYHNLTVFGNLQHIAASQGNINCVLVLLDYGADPNGRGNIILFS